MTDVQVVLQPIINVHTGQCEAYETLARLTTPDGRVTGPLGLVSSGSWANLDIQVRATLRDWGLSGRDVPGSLFVNISPETLLSNETFRAWRWAFDAAQLANMSPLVLEVSERTPADVLKERWDELESLGAGLAVDDFGTGHATGGRLQQYPWSFCKFEAQRLLDSMDEAAVAYCHSQGIQTIAEKVECWQQAERAVALGIGIHQGYLYARPGDRAPETRTQQRVTA